MQDDPTRFERIDPKQLPQYIEWARQAIAKGSYADAVQLIDQIRQIDPYAAQHLKAELDQIQQNDPSSAASLGLWPGIEENPQCRKNIEDALAAIKSGDIQRAEELTYEAMFVCEGHERAKSVYDLITIYREEVDHAISSDDPRAVKSHLSSLLSEPGQDPLLQQFGRALLTLLQARSMPESESRREQRTPALSRQTLRSEQSTFFLASPGILDSPPVMTPAYLVQTIAPYLQALARIQSVLDQATGQPPTLIQIRSLSQNSPISLSLDGAASALELILNLVVPWRRKHAKELAVLTVKKAEVEIMELRVRARRELEEADKLASERLLVEEQARAQRMENDRRERELQAEVFKLAVFGIDHAQPNLPDEVRYALASQLKEPLEVTIFSELEPQVAAPPAPER
jgi:hypothetical protein